VEQSFINLAARLPIEARRPSARILAHTFTGDAQQLPVADSTVQLAEPFGRIGRREFP